METKIEAQKLDLLKYLVGKLVEKFYMYVCENSFSSRRSTKLVLSLHFHKRHDYLQYFHFILVFVF